MHYAKVSCFCSSESFTIGLQDGANEVRITTGESKTDNVTIFQIALCGALQPCCRQHDSFVPRPEQAILSGSPSRFLEGPQSQSLRELPYPEELSPSSHSARSSRLPSRPSILGLQRCAFRRFVWWLPRQRPQWATGTVPDVSLFSTGLLRMTMKSGLRPINCAMS